MQRSINDGYRNNSIPNPFTTLFKSYVDEDKLSALDFMLRLECALIMAAVNGERFSESLIKMWKHYFPEVLFHDQIVENANEYMERDRLTMKLVSVNEYIRSDRARLKTLVPLVIILNINNRELIVDEIYRQTADWFNDVSDDRNTIQRRISEVLQHFSCPFGKNVVIADYTFRIINECKEKVSDLLDELKRPLINKDRYLQQQMSPIGFARAVCLIEKSLQETACKMPKEQLLQRNWDSIFEGIPYSEENLKSVLNSIRGNRFLEALCFLFQLSIKDIRNARIVRMVAVVRSVNNVLAHTPRALSKTALQESSMLLYSQFNVVSNGFEELDIANYINCFLTPNAELDERVLAIFREQKDILESNFKNAQEELNQSKTRNYYVEVLRSQNDKQVAELQEKVAGSRFAVLSSLIEMLSCSTYGYLLGKIYRIANEYDEPDVESTITLCKDLLQVLRMFDIMPINEKVIGMPYKNLNMDECKIVLDRFTGYSSPEVVYPGWQIEGNVVSLPVATEEDESEGR